MSNLEHFNLGPVSDVDPDVLTDQILNALGLYIEDDEAEEKTLKSMDTLTDLMQKVAEGKITASAALSLTKSAGLHNQDVEDAIVAKSVIGRKAIAGMEQIEEDEAIEFGVRRSRRSRLRDALDMNGDGLVTQEDVDLFLELWLNQDNKADLDGDGDVDLDDWNLFNEMIGEYGGSDAFDEIEEEDKDKDKGGTPHQNLDRNGDGVIDQAEWNAWLNRYNNGNVQWGDLNGDGVVDQSDLDIALDQLNQFGEEGVEPLLERSLQKIIQLVGDHLLSDKGPELTPRQAEAVIGKVSQTFGTHHTLPARFRNYVASRGKDAGKVPSGGQPAPTAEAGGAIPWVPPPTAQQTGGD